MTHVYKTVMWNRSKKVYDLLLGLGIVMYLVSFMAVGLSVWSGNEQISPPILAIRAFGSAAIIMLHIVLAIGPLARISTFFSPLLYNRRHFGVMTFALGLLHGLIVLVWYHGFGELNPLTSVLTSNDQYRSISQFPFEVFGAAALMILFLMAVTSHDFWLANLGARFWKTLHMGVYFAYGLLVLHVGLGFLQSETSSLYANAMIAGLATLGTLHLISGFREWRKDHKGIWLGNGTADWVYVARMDEIKENHAKVVTLGSGERVAVWHYDGQVSITSNVCAHQAGPLGEGRIIDGCITCPWHGFQYDPKTGRAPPPYDEVIEIYSVRIDNGEIYVAPKPLPLGAMADPVEADP